MNHRVTLKTGSLKSIKTNLTIIFRTKKSTNLKENSLSYRSSSPTIATKRHIVPPLPARLLFNSANIYIFSSPSNSSSLQHFSKMTTRTSLHKNPDMYGVNKRRFEKQWGFATPGKTTFTFSLIRSVIIFPLQLERKRGRSLGEENVFRCPVGVRLRKGQIPPSIRRFMVLESGYGRALECALVQWRKSHAMN